MQATRTNKYAFYIAPLENDLQLHDLAAKEQHQKHLQMQPPANLSASPLDTDLHLQRLSTLYTAPPYHKFQKQCFLRRFSPFPRPLRGTSTKPSPGRQPSTLCRPPPSLQSTRLEELLVPPALCFTSFIALLLSRLMICSSWFPPALTLRALICQMKPSPATRIVHPLTICTRSVTLA